MANKRDTDGNVKSPVKQGVVGESFDAPFRGYVNLNLNDAEKLAWQLWSTTGDIWDVLDAQERDGINISVKRDPKGAGSLASATQRRVGSPNAGLVVTARGGTASVALSRVVYSLIILSRTERWEDTQPMADPDRW